MKTFVTVVICTWNRAEVLARTLEQMTRLVVPDHVGWELIVVNNCCTDATDQVVTSFMSRLPLRLLHERQAGQSHARNLAIREARGSWVMWTDDDVLIDPQWMVATLAAAATFEAQWVFGPSRPLWPEAEPSWYSPRHAGAFALLDYGDAPFLVTTPDRPFYGLNFSAERQALVSLQGFDTGLGLRGNGGGMGEDIDVFERALASGFRIVYTPDAVVTHIIPPARTKKQRHRRGMWVATAVYFRRLREMFPDVPTIFGVPRFLYRKAVQDAMAWIRCAATRNATDGFYYELQLVRFARLVVEAVRS